MVNGDNNYISLKEATRYCKYSQEYLSLRARQGKLKAEKIGRNWLIKKEWLEEYLARTEEYNNKLAIKKAEKIQEKAPPPGDLPIGEFDESVPARLVETQRRASVLRFGFAAVMIFIVLVTGIVFSFRMLQGKTPVVVREVEDSIESWVVVVGRGEVAEVWRNTVNVFRKYFKWVGQQVLALGREIKEISRKIVQGLKSITQ